MRLLERQTYTTVPFFKYRLLCFPSFTLNGFLHLCPSSPQSPYPYGEICQWETKKWQWKCLTISCYIYSFKWKKKNYVHLWSIFILPQTQKIKMSSAGRQKRVNNTEVKETWVTQGQQAPFCWCGSLLSGSVMRTIGCWLKVSRMPRQWHNLRSDPICFLLSFLPKHSHISMNLFSIAPSF